MAALDKPVIRIHFEDFHNGCPAWFGDIVTRILERRYTPVRDAKNPEYLFLSCFAHRHINYSCTKIYYTSENVTPEFNRFDYGIGFDYLSFGDRYLRLPYYRFFMRDADFAPKSPEFFVTEAARKTRFCNYLYSNMNSSNPVRRDFFLRLSKYKKTDSGGKELNNIGFLVGDKETWQRDYKFSIAFENSRKCGYVTEKLYDALRAHTIPIYWGDPCVASEFNSKRFINCADYPSLDAVVEKVRELDNDPTAYQAMLSEPWFAGPQPPFPEQDSEFERYLFNIVEQGPEASRRVTTHGYTARYLNDVGPRTYGSIVRKTTKRFLASCHKRRTELKIIWNMAKRRFC